MHFAFPVFLFLLYAQGIIVLFMSLTFFFYAVPTPPLLVL